VSAASAEAEEGASLMEHRTADKGIWQYHAGAQGGQWSIVESPRKSAQTSHDWLVGNGFESLDKESAAIVAPIHVYARAQLLPQNESREFFVLLELGSLTRPIAIATLPAFLLFLST
jgi:hypothetical protein